MAIMYVELHAHKRRTMIVHPDGRQEELETLTSSAAAQELHYRGVANEEDVLEEGAVANKIC